MYRTIVPRDNFSLMIGIGAASLMTVAGCFAIVLMGILLWPSMGPREEEVLGVAVAFLPTGIATWWLFRRVRVRYTKQEARLVAIIFAIITPVSLVIAFACAQIPAGYVAYLGRPLGLFGAFVTSVLIATFLGVVLCVLALGIKRGIAGNGPEH